MKMLVIGDSISHGNYIDLNNEWHFANPTYCDFVANKLCVKEYLNASVSGTSFSSSSRTNPEHCIYNKSIDKFNYDLVLVEGGTNDYGTDVELGSFDDRTPSTFCGAFYLTLQNIVKNNPNAKIFVLLPIHRLNEFNKNKAGHTLYDYRNAMKTIANIFDIVTIDGFECGLDFNDKKCFDEYSHDGLHPVQEGHLLLGKFVYKNIKKYL